MTDQLIPEAALDKHVALLGMTGSGKTSVIKTAIVEPDLRADRRVLIITPKDDWWGLRLSRNGKIKGFGIPIFGGHRGDYQLEVKDAALLAEAYGTMRGSAILCTAKLSVQDRARWFSAFAERILTTNKGWVRVVIDEAHVFMPKQGGKGGGAIPAGLHAGNELVSQGRSQGLRIVLASQRSAKLHNDALTQCSCLMAMLLMAPPDREAVRDWIIDQADPERGKEIIASLANLKPGQAWVWAPAVKFLERVQFPLPSTFDSSAAPDDETSNEHKLAPVDLDALKGKLATVEEDRKANDPKELRAEILALKKKLSEPNAGAAEAKMEGYQAGYAAAMEFIAAEVAPAMNSIRNVTCAVDSICTDARKKDAPKVAAPKPGVTARTYSERGHPPPKRSAVQNGQYSDPQLRVLRSLTMWRSLGHDAPSREMVAAGAGYRPTSGGYKNILGKLASAGAIGRPANGLVSLVAENIDVMDRTDARDILRNVLSAPQNKIVDALLTCDGVISRDALAAKVEYEPTSGGYKNILGQLNTLDITEKPAQGLVALSPWVRELLG